MKLHGHPRSGCTRRVLFALAEKGYDVPLVVVSLPEGQQRSLAHRALHPFGKVPVLEDGGFVLYESSAIVRYLDERLDGPHLVPASPQGRARMEQWISATSAYLAAGTWALMQHLVLAPMFGREPDHAAVTQGRTDVGAVLDVADAALARSPYLAGETFSLAEVFLAPVLQFLDEARQGDLVAERPSLDAYWQRVRGRAGWQKVLRACQPRAMPPSIGMSS